MTPERGVATPDSCVVHLVWAPLGSGPLEGFVAAYRDHDAGMEHRLTVILNGFRGPGDARLAPVERLLERVEHARVLVSRPVPDLSAYRQAAEEIDARWLCFLNSYSRPLVDGWLSLLADSFFSTHARF